MCKVSVIVPVYNVEKYLKQCIESLINQTFEDIEIILVDDGSDDDSGIICDDYAKKDNRIKVLHKKNSGVSAARKYGVENASGQYICFIDSDDYVQKDFVKEMHDAITENGADIAECDYTVFSKSFSNTKKLYEKSFAAEREDFLDKIVKNTIIYGEVAVVMWNKMYKREIILNLVKDYGKSLLEDYIFNIQYYAGVNKYVYINKPLVNYRQTEGSLSRKYNPQTYSILKNVHKMKTEFMQNVGLNDEICIELANKWYIHYTYSFLKRIFITNIGLLTKNMKTAVIQVLKDRELNNICLNLKNKNSFARNICAEKYENILCSLYGEAFVYKTKYRLAKVKRYCMRGNI